MAKPLPNWVKKNKNVLVVDADLAHATMTVEFANQFPDRFYNFGIAEANMMCGGIGFG